MVAAELMGMVYWRLLKKLERAQFDVFGPQPVGIVQTAKAGADFSILVAVLFWDCRSGITEIRSMASSSATRRLIVNADDFGLSHSVNEAVIRAHRTKGILTSASLMVNEAGFAEAVKLAKENPKLGVGLHVSLLHGHSALPPEKIPGLVNARREFSNSPVGAGTEIFF